jgi:hypothetical protein
MVRFRLAISSGGEGARDYVFGVNGHPPEFGGIRFCAGLWDRGG